MQNRISQNLWEMANSIYGLRQLKLCYSPVNS